MKSKNEIYKHPIFPIMWAGEWDEVDTDSATLYDVEFIENFGCILKGKYKSATYLGGEATIQVEDQQGNLLEQKYKAIPLVE